MTTWGTAVALPSAYSGVAAGYERVWGIAFAYDLTGYNAGFTAGLASIDRTPPVITIVSPTPGVAPGSPGGFPADWATAKDTPIVFTVTDISPGLSYVAVVARFNGGADEETVYRRGSFRGEYVGLSVVTSIANGLQFQVRRVGGWPPGGVTFAIDPLDGYGNLST